MEKVINLSVHYNGVRYDSIPAEINVTGEDLKNQIVRQSETYLNGLILSTTHLYILEAKSEGCLFDMSKTLAENNVNDGDCLVLLDKGEAGCQSADCAG